MNKTEKTKSIISLSLKTAWLVAGIVLWILGLFMFLDHKEFLRWMAWGILCTPFIIPFLISMISDGAKSGRHQGANSYTAKDCGTHIRVENHPLRGALVGGVIGLVIGVLAGPIFYPITAAKKTISLVGNIKSFVAAMKKESNN